MPERLWRRDVSAETGRRPPVWGTSYSAVTGPWEWDEFFLVPGTGDQLIPGQAQRIAQLGLIYPLSSVRLAQVTDGLSNTLLFGETAFTAWYGYWTLGDGYDTLVGTTAPPNSNDVRSCRAGSLSSMYEPPSRRGELHLRRRLGQVHQELDQLLAVRPGRAIDPQPGLDPIFNIPYGPYPIPCGPLYPPGAYVGVWQALSTRGGGEVIGDAY